MNRIPPLTLLALLSGSVAPTWSCSSQEGPRPPAIAPWPDAATAVPVSPRPAPTATAPAPVPAGDPRSGSCTAAEPVVLSPGAGADPQRMRSLVAGFSGEGGLVAWPSGPERFEAALLDRDLHVASRIAADLTGSARLFDVLPLAGGFVVAAHDLCPDGKQFQKCLFTRMVRAGAEPGPVATIRTKEWIQGWFPVAISPAEIVTLRSHMYEDPVVERWRVGPDGAAAVEQVRSLGRAGSHSWARAFDAAGTGWCAAVENDNGAWRMIDDGGRETPLRFVPGGSRVDSLARDGDGVAVVFTPLGRDGRPLRSRLARLRAGGALIEPPRPLGDDEQLPGGLAERVLPALEVRGKDLVLVRRNGAGFPVGQPTPLGAAPLGHGPEEPLLRAFAAGPGRFGAAWSSFEGDRFVVRLASISCGH